MTKSQLEELEELNPSASELETTSSVVNKSNTIESKISMVELEIQTLADMHKRRKRIDFGNDKKDDTKSSFFHLFFFLHAKYNDNNRNSRITSN